MAKGIRIDGEKLNRLWRESLLSQEMFAEAAGYGRSGLARLVRPGVQSMHATNFDKLATFLKMERRELFKLIGVTGGETAKRQTADDAAVSRMLRGEPVMEQQLIEEAEQRGVTLLELYREITRSWLAEHRAPRVKHTGLEGLKRRPPSDPPSVIGAKSPVPPAEKPRRGRPAARNG